MAVKRYNGTSWDTVAGAGTPGAAGIVTSATAPSDTSVLWADTTVTTNNALIPAGGTTGQVLSKTSSSDYAASWSTPVSGKLLQIVTGTTITQVGNSTSTFADTGLTATITPTSATSTILIMADLNTRKNTGTQAAVKLRLMRGATAIWNTTGLHYTNTEQYNGARTPIMYMDSPASTSALTYKVQFANADNSNGVSVCFDGTAGFTHDIHLIEIGA